MTVYFAKKIDGDGEIKIGSSARVERRLKTIANSSGPIRLLATCEGDAVEERYFQKRFAHLRTEGEWFRAEQELLDFINDNAEPADAVFEPSEPVWKSKVLTSRRDFDIQLASELLALKMGRFPRGMPHSEALETTYQELSEMGEGWTRRRVRSIHERTPLRIDFYEIIDLMKLAGIHEDQVREIVRTGRMPPHAD